MDLTHLGRPSPLPASPEEAKLDYVANPRPGRINWCQTPISYRCGILCLSPSAISSSGSIR